MLQLKRNLNMENVAKTVQVCGLWKQSNWNQVHVLKEFVTSLNLCHILFGSQRRFVSIFFDKVFCNKSIKYEIFRLHLDVSVVKGMENL